MQLVHWSWEGDRVYQSLTVLSIQKEFVPANPGVPVTVEVRNDGPAPAQDVRGVAWSLYDSNLILGKPVAEVLCPGAVATFHNYLNMLVSDPDSIKAAAQGSPVSSSNSPDACP